MYVTVGLAITVPKLVCSSTTSAGFFVVHEQGISVVDLVKGELISVFQKLRCHGIAQSSRGTVAVSVPKENKVYTFKSGT